MTGVVLPSALGPQYLVDLGESVTTEVYAKVVAAAPMPQNTLAGTIAASASLSDVIDLNNARLAALVAPAAWTAAALTFAASVDGTTFYPLYDEAGTEVSYTLTAGAFVRLPLASWLGVRYLKLRSGTAATPVAQAAERAFTLVLQ